MIEQLAGGLVSKAKDGSSLTCPTAFQAALDASDVIGSLDWDIFTACVRADALVALLFGVDPDLAEAGAPFAKFTAGIHADDRERVVHLMGECAQAGSSYVAEFRVCSADGVARWVLTRGRFELDAAGRPCRGRGIIIDITSSRMSEHAYVRSEKAVTGHPLEQAAEHCLSAHKVLKAFENPQLKLLSEMLLLEVGRNLAELEGSRRRERMN
ncbi:PAS domain-containing protein [Methylobacterium durans]|uniref:PAS domain-containing protein n=1 Tax=Methylobacterium durans TaxID=2202825 RepID=UPI002AFEE200|nr:PAS domain-containing protein [Methylobacterium durans]MEA1834771.1 PAS domain-containing protein [Methylobacterium durans]